MVFASKKRGVLAVAVLVMLAFMAGIAVGHYQFFPYQQLRLVKNIVTGTVPAPSVQSADRARRMSIQARVSIHEDFDSRSDVVMVGDSITDYAEWSEMFPGISIANRGIAGDTTTGILERLDTIVATHAKTAFVMAGVNDIFSGDSVGVIVKNYSVIIDELLQAGMQPSIQSTLLVGESRMQFNPAIEELNLALEALADEKGVRFIDLNQKLATNGVLDKRYTPDAIHLNGAGYQVWQEAIKPIINRYAIAAR